MTWTAFQWVWQLEAPLFIGMSPAGALNRCRPYVPARVLWGAVTAEISRSENGQKFPNYEKIGSYITINTRFTYLYPAEKKDGKFMVWMPKYETAKGIHWYCQNSRESLSDRDFRHRLLDSRPGTAITPETDSAAEGTLREIECINPWWRHSSDSQRKPTPMLLSGCVFLKNNDLRKKLNNIDTLFIGGDTRYGLGKICRVGPLQNLSGDLSIFEKPINLNKENPEIRSKTVWGHAEDIRKSKDGRDQILGMKEFLGGWDRGKLRRGKLMWTPGSYHVSTDQEKTPTWSINQAGYWIHQERTADNDATTD